MSNLEEHERKILLRNLLSKYAKKIYIDDEFLGETTAKE